MMRDEIELKFLDIDDEDIQEKLRGIGATKTYMAETVSVWLNWPEIGVDWKDMEKQSLRLRKRDGTCMLNWKKPKEGEDMKVLEEMEIEVSSMEDTIALFESLGFSSTRAFHKKRTHYEHKGTSFEIDEIPGKKPYLEVETHTQEEMESACKNLGLDIEDGKSGSMMEIFPDVFK